MNERRESIMVIAALPSDLDEFGGAMNGGAHARVGPAAADIGHPASMSASLGWGLCERSATAAMICPDWQ